MLDFQKCVDTWRGWGAGLSFFFSALSSTASSWSTTSSSGSALTPPPHQQSPREQWSWQTPIYLGPGRATGLTNYVGSGRCIGECFIRRLVITGSSLLFQGVPDSPDVFQSSARILSWRPLWRGSLVPSRGVWVLCPKVPALVFHFNVNGNCTFSFSGSTLYFLLGKIPEFTWCLATMTWASIMLSVPI